MTPTIASACSGVNSASYQTPALPAKWPMVINLPLYWLTAMRGSGLNPGLPRMTPVLCGSSLTLCASASSSSLDILTSGGGGKGCDAGGGRLSAESELLLIALAPPKIIG